MTALKITFNPKGGYTELFTGSFKTIHNDPGYYSKSLSYLSEDLDAIKNFFVDSKDSYLEPATNGLSTLQRIDLLSSVSYYLRVSGKTEEALESQFVNLRLAQGNSGDGPYLHELAKISENYVSLLIVCGKLQEAFTVSEKGLEFAEKSGHAHLQIINYIQHATVLRRLGLLKESKSKFEKAVKKQKEWYESDQDAAKTEELTHSQGVRFWAFLLDYGSVEEISKIESLIDSALEEKSIEKVEKSLYLLIKGRICEYYGKYNEAINVLSHSLSLMRQSGRVDYLPRILIKLSGIYRRLNKINDSKRTVDEAMKISIRSNMKLYIAECHLLLGNLFLDAHRITHSEKAMPSDKMVVLAQEIYSSTLAQAKYGPMYNKLMPDQIENLRQLDHNALIHNAYLEYCNAEVLIQEIGYKFRKPELEFLASRLTFYSKREIDSRNYYDHYAQGYRSLREMDRHGFAQEYRLISEELEIKQ